MGNQLMMQVLTCLLRLNMSLTINLIHKSGFNTTSFTQGKVGEAKKSYKTASRIDESSMLACLGKKKMIMSVMPFHIL